MTSLRIKGWVVMSAGNRVSESREVAGFDRVSLKDYGELVIMQGEEESLKIEAKGDILAKIETKVRDGTLEIGIRASFLDKLGDVLTASLARKGIKYNLSVKKLATLEILGVGSVKISDLKSDHLTLILAGVGAAKIESLKADLLEVDLRGAGTIELSGKVAKQKITLGGAGTYSAPRLESGKASIHLKGAGKATVWAVDDLAAVISGIGKVAYFGSPKVNENVSGLGRVTHQGNI